MDPKIAETVGSVISMSLILMGFGIGLFGSSKARLEASLRTMETDRQQVRFSLPSSLPSDVKYGERLKVSLMVPLFIACVCLILTVFSAATAFFIMSGMTVSGPIFIDSTNSFQPALVAFNIARLLLVFGLFCLGMVYVQDFIAISKGATSITTGELKVLNKLFKGREPSKAGLNFLFISPFVFVIVMAVIEILVPYNQWVKMGLALGAGVVLIVIGLFSTRRT